MTPVPVTVRTLTEYVQFIENECKPERILFRGQSADRPLLPRIARVIPRRDVAAVERQMLEDFRLQALPYIETKPESDWEWLAVAQHFGMATRLLDWTLNPLAALWFAVEYPAQLLDTGVVWLFEVDADDYLQHGDTVGPLDIDRTRVFRPRHVTRRIIAQAGWFTAHRFRERGQKRYVSLEKNKRYKDRLRKLVVPREAFACLRAELNRCGVNAASLYGGIDGVCRHVEWSHTLLTDEENAGP